MLCEGSEHVGTWFLVPVIGRQGRTEPCEFEARLIYVVSTKLTREGYIVRYIFKKVKQNNKDL